MNVGDYIRIDGYISKIGHMKISSSGKTYVQWKQPNGLLANANIKLIEKSSPQIIDLIEVGDYVNGLRVEKNKYGELYTSYVYYGGDIGKQCEVYTNWVKEMQEENIYTIATHEQMEAMQYRVEK